MNISVDKDSKSLEEIKKQHRLILYNDDHNIFDWVIHCIMSILGYSSTRAEQLAIIAHYKGKATLKSGNYKDLSLYKDSINENGLNSIIE